MDSLLGTLVILLIMAASSWLQRKAEELQQRKPPARPPMRPPVGAAPPRGATPQTQTPAKPVRKIDWQEELRRLLEGDAAPPAEPPPVVVREAQPPAPPPIVIAPRPAARPVFLAEETEEGPRSSRLTEASAAYKKAQQLHDAAALRLQQVSDHSRHDHSGKVPIQAKVRSPEIAAAISLLRNPSTVRRAFISSIVFNPPKGLEN
jgi:hypothetical protein